MTNTLEVPYPMPADAACNSLARLMLAQVVIAAWQHCYSELSEPEPAVISHIIDVALGAMNMPTAPRREVDTNHPGFLVWNPHGVRPPVFVHATLEGCRSEAARLAGVHVDQRFYVMAPVDVAIAERRVAPVILRTVQPGIESNDEIPF